MNTDMIKRETFSAIVAQVEKSKQDFSTAIEILEKTQKEICLNGECLEDG